MKKITLMIGFLILSVSTIQVNAAQSGNAFEIARGQARYIFTHSKVANIVSARNAATDALLAALNEILTKCTGENFDLIDVKFFKGMNGGSIIVNAAVEYICK